MNIQLQETTLKISGVKELGAANSNAFREQVRAALPTTLHAIEIDLSETSFIDSCGLGALISLYKTANSLNGGVSVRLLNPSRRVQQLFELTRLHRIFEIVQR